tara:strand:+ start:83 stop:544 length:462 start_codon:yes stop_codon:yes gene_type:complete
MATTATISIASSGMLSNPISISKTMTMYKDNTTSTDFTQMNYHRLELPVDNYGGGTPTNLDLIPESDALKDTANYVYICNASTSDTQYVTISINSAIIGSLYGGDFLMIPWACDLSHATNDSTIEAQAFGATQNVEYALFHVGETLATANDTP